jgi:hypothetical protein
LNTDIRKAIDPAANQWVCFVSLLYVVFVNILISIRCNAGLPSQPF